MSVPLYLCEAYTVQSETASTGQQATVKIRKCQQLSTRTIRVSVDGELTSFDLCEDCWRALQWFPNRIIFRPPGDE